jgi:Mrp family chromosome partitioning ATPase
MGRMIDILRRTDRRPSTTAPASEKPVEGNNHPAAVAEPTAPMREAQPVAPPLEDDDDVPFIEVGGPREPALRLVPAPRPSPGIAVEESGVRVLGFGKQATAPSFPPPPPSRERPEEPRAALLSIQFRPVHAATLGGRGPVAELVTFHQPDHAVSDQYRALAAEISRQLPGAQPRVLIVVGAAEGVGTSTVLLNLAVTLARQDSTVTIVDAHLARPALAESLAMPGAPGLRDVLAGRMPAAWCVQETAHPNLFVLPAGAATPAREDYDVAPILGMLRERGEWLLIDVGPWVESSSTAALAGGCDAVYLVMRQEMLAETAALQESVMRQTGRLRGCVLTAREG